MKKTYLSPEIDLQLAETEEMIAASVKGFDSKLDDTNEIDDPNKMLSRRRGSWNDDVEEEEEF